MCEVDELKTTPATMMGTSIPGISGTDILSMTEVGMTGLPETDMLGMTEAGMSGTSEADILRMQVPSMLIKSPLFWQIYDNQGAELDNLDNAVSDVLNQYFVESATWGLDRWEGFLGIPTDTRKPEEYRRSVILAKLRGIGTVTVAMMKNVANSFRNGDVDIIELNYKYSFKVKFVSTIGIPPNLQDLKDAIENIKPAHLGIVYEFSYLLIKNIHLVMALTELESTPLHKFAGGVFIVE